MLQRAITNSAAAGRILFLDYGVYLVTSTIYVPAGARIFGEVWPAITASGGFFQNYNNPQPVFQIGKSGETGVVEMQNVVFQTRGTVPGATLIQYNLNSGSAMSGLWDVHTRIGGSAGTNLQSAQCAYNPSSTVIKTSCIGAFMLMHVTNSAGGLMLENDWFWVADRKSFFFSFVFDAQILLRHLHS